MKDSKSSLMKVFKAPVWRGVAIGFVLLAAVCIAGTSLANDYSSMVNSALGIQTSTTSGSSEDAQYYTSDYDNIEDMMQAKVQLLREIGQEGTVLLKNTGVLPVASGKNVTVINADSVMYENGQGGGSMSSETSRSGITSFVSALEHDGLTVSTSETSESTADAVIIVLGRKSAEGNDLGASSLALTSTEISQISTAKSNASGRVVLFVSGEYGVEVGDYVNDDGIGAIIKCGNAGFRGAYGIADVICGEVSPSGRLVDTYAADPTYAPAAMNAGDYSYTNQNSIMASQANKYVSYSEGIYTDYKYYETRYEDSVLGQGNAASAAGSSVSGNWTYSNEVLYPYGYGLSYTTFSQQIVGDPVFNAEDHTATITVKVTNTGSVAGKDVVEVYGQSPYTDYDITNKVEKASVQLLGFGKTGTLAANGGSEEVEVTIHMQWLASYDYTNAKGYIMDTGDYYFALGNGAHEAVNNILAAKGKTTSNGMTADGDSSLTYKWHQDALDTTTYANSVYTGEQVTNRFDDADVNYWSAGSVTYLTRNSWDTTFPQTLSLTATSGMLSVLNDTKKYENGTLDLKDRAASEEVTYVDITTEADVNSAVTNGTISIQSVVVLREKDYDDPAWDTLLDNMTIYEMDRLVAQGRDQISACPSVTFNSCYGSDSPIGIQENYVNYSIDKETGEKTLIASGQTITDGITDDKLDIGSMDGSLYSSEPVLAATFNTSLAERQGAMMAEDGLYTDTSYLWGLGANIHRTAYCGRYAEYYSSDSVHAALMGGAVSKACKEHGLIIVAKHFALNEQEANRIGVATFCNEQALRENYLRAFEGIATYGEMTGIMTSYNRIGLIGASSEYDLATGMLSEEWGSTAYVITDLTSPTAGLYDGNASVIAGVSTMMNNGTYDSTSGSYVNCTLNVDNVKADQMLLTAVREGCHRILYNFIHSNGVNGIGENSQVLFVTPWWQSALVAVDVIATVVAVLAAAMYIISVNLKKKGE